MASVTVEIRVEGLEQLREQLNRMSAELDELMAEVNRRVSRELVYGTSPLRPRGILAASSAAAALPLPVVAGGLLAAAAADAVRSRRRFSRRDLLTLGMRKDR